MAEPVTRVQAKADLKVEFADDDTLIDDLIVDAREFVERETGLVLVPRAITETAAGLGRWIDLSSWPVSAVTAIRYPLGGVMTTLGPGAWAVGLKRRPVRILPGLWNWGVGGAAYSPCAALPVEIDLQAGYATPADVPRNATRAMRLVIAHWYANRSAVESGARAAAIEMPLGVSVLLRKLKLTRV